MSMSAFDPLSLVSWAPSRNCADKRCLGAAVPARCTLALERLRLCKNEACVAWQAFSRGGLAGQSVSTARRGDRPDNKFTSWIATLASPDLFRMPGGIYAGGLDRLQW